MASCVECLHYNVCYKKPIRNVDTELVMIGDCSDYKPTADVEEVRRGEWIEKFKDGFWYYDCPFCDDGYVVMERDENKPNYCHNCGAKMDGGKEE